MSASAKRLLGVLTAAALLVPASAASAGTLTETPDGERPAYEFDALPGEVNDLAVTDTGSALLFDDAGPIALVAAGADPRCVQEGEDVRCPYRTPAYRAYGLTVGTRDEDDRVDFTGTRVTPSVNGGAGDDVLLGPTGVAVASFLATGDGGDDRIEARGAFDANFTGGAGDDVLVGGTRAGRWTTMRGEDGADRFEPGAGLDQVIYDGDTDVRVTVDDRADDGRPGEGDDVRRGIDLVVGSDGDDVLVGSELGETLVGRGGGDRVEGMAGDDRLVGGQGDDTMLGGEGGDVLSMELEDGADLLRGGPGVDRATLGDRFDLSTGTSFTGDVRATLDDRADDGAAGEGDDLGSDLEDVTTGGGGDTIVGDEGINLLSGGPGDDTIDGAGGSDELSGAAGDDDLRARDGAPDRVECGPGTDRAVVDELDAVSGCETVERAPAPATAAASTQTTAQPGPGGTTTTAAPGPQPPATATARRRPAGLTLALLPARDRRAPYRFTARGRLLLPDGIAAAEGCSGGIVAVTVKRGTRTLSTRRARLRPDCSYASTVSFRDRRRLGRRGALRVSARFAGNALLAARTSRRAAARAG